MAMVAHDKAKAEKLGIKQSVARDFMEADRGRDLSKLPAKVRPKGSAVRR